VMTLSHRTLTCGASGCVVCVVSHSDMIALITSAPILVFELQAENTVQRWLDLLGPVDSAAARDSHPNSIRARYGTGLSCLL